MRDLSFVLGRRRGAFLGILVLGLVVNTGMTVLSPLFFQQLFDRCVPARDMRLFAGLMAGFIALATGWRLLTLRLSLQTQELKQALLRDLSSELLRKYYRLPYPEASRFPPAYYASRIFDEPLAATSEAVDLSLAVASAAAALVSALALLVALSLKATLLLALCVPPLLLVARKYGRAVTKQADAEKEEEGRLRGFLTRAVSAYKSVALFSLGGRVCEGLDSRLAAVNELTFQRLRSSGLHNTIGAIVTSYAETLVIIVCGYEMMRGRMAFGSFMAFMSCFWAAVNALRALIAKVPELAKNKALVARLREFLAAPEKEAAARSAGAVAFEDVEFGYGQEAVLSRLSFSVRRGDKLLLQGRNGSGKSTIANLLASFLSPTKGGVMTCAVERVSAALTPQHFIPGTVRDNLGYERLSAAQRAYVGGLLADLGLESALDRDPESLSSGQRKKVEVVMGLSKDADLYVFDEPLANVDAESKKKLLDRIFERTEGKALVVVMHGDDELKARFDRVLELDPRY